ncbi:MAG: hypothetical protein HY074_06830 [Deltaproteobacteria bacterium]|nr:hypothetical protein [Deltaproteobacteria bacterium]
MKIKFLVLVTLLLSTVARAEDPDIVVVGWFDHFTYGLINTAIGIPVAITGIIANAVTRHQVPRVTFDSTGQQIRISSSNLNGFDYSTGAIHHGSCCDAHEAGHGKESGVLGPAYLPVVGLTYLIQGMDVGVMEDWADAWQDLGKTMVNNHPYRVEFDVRSRDGSTTNRVGLNFVLLERASKVNVGSHRGDDNPTEVIYQYGKIGVYLMVPTTGAEGVLVGGSAPSDANTIFPARVEATVLEKDFAARWTVVGGVFSVLTDSKEETGAVAWDLTDKRVQAKILSQTVGFGVRVGDENKVALDLMGRANAAVQGLWFTGYGGVAAAAQGPSPGVMVTAGVEAEARLHVLNHLEIFAKKSKEWQLGGKYSRDIEVVGAETPMYFNSKTFTFKRGTEKGKPVPWFGGVKYVREVEEYPDFANGMAKSEIKSFFFTLGGRW